MNRTDAPVVKDLVLLGGGHSHVAVLKRFGMEPMPGVRVTLICKDVNTPYSGMLPGFIAGHYQFDDAHIDLRPLCNFAGAQFYQATVTGLDLKNRLVHCAGRPPASFDLLSINIGSTPRARDIPGALQHALPVKPIDRFISGWENILAQARERAGKPWRIVVVGGGAGGVELALCTQHRLRRLLAESGAKPDTLEHHLVTDSATVLPTHNARVQRIFTRILGERGVRVHLNHRVVEVKAGELICQPGERVAFDTLLWVTNASPAPWLADAGLQTDDQGFVLVNDCLQSVSHPHVFAAGDIAAVVNHPRPKSGVFAVRQGPPLARNLRQVLNGLAPESFAPQTQFLSLISTGDQYAVASRGPWAAEGANLWRLKDWIDRRWMRKYQELPEMNAAPPAAVAATGDAASSQEISSTAMRCGGCGAKVGSDVLSRVLQRLKPVARPDILIGLDAPDDAALTTLAPGMAAVQTVDFFRSFINDPYVFGRIAANHALGDIFAMGAEPQSALAIATIPYGAEGKVEEQLFQLLAGAVEVLNESHTALVGGHSAEAPELAFGLSVTGLVAPDRALRKGGLKAGEVLILTKPLGTGTLFAADMRRRAKGAWIEAAVASMQVSNRKAAQCFLRHRATTCTDVTGFGLLGHLVEMAKASGVDAEIQLAQVPLLAGALETVRAGILSSLQPQNVRLRRAIANVEEAARDERYPLIFDPQTAGGLLASVPASEAAACVAELQQAGYAQAVVVGAVRERAGDECAITVRG
ncbi:MAG: selenide, water dikinase SelD [Verrucomicrobiota bacterium]